MTPMNAKSIAAKARKLPDDEKENWAIRNFLGLQGEQLALPISRSSRDTERGGSWIYYFSLGWKDFDDIQDFFALSAEQQTLVQLKSDLVLALRKRLRKEGLTHEDAAQRSGVSRSSLTARVGGNLARVSLDRLLDVCLKLGVNLKFQVTA
jgi:predicted XRE-type DNA-binding protein